MRTLAFFALAAMAAVTFAQPAHSPIRFELVRTDGSRQDLDVGYLFQISLLPTSFEHLPLTLPRDGLRFFCRARCPTEISRQRTGQDTIYWRDGRQTLGYVNVHREVVEQNGRPAGRIAYVDRIEFGTARPRPALLTTFRPGTVSIFGRPRDQRSSVTGEYVVFRVPWVSMTEQSLIIQGRDPIPRGEIRFVSHTGPRWRFLTRDPPVAEDVVTWSDGSRTSGRVLIRNGRVEQPRRPPRSFNEVDVIELATGP